MSGSRAGFGGSRAGLTLLEVLIAAAISVVVVLLGGFLFLGQLRGYRDLDVQAKIQTQAKIAVQSMSRDIGNTGAVLDDKRLNFQMQSSRIQLAYMDLKGRHCAASDTVTTSFYVTKSPLGDTLMQQIRCNSRTPTRRAIVKGVGTINLGFTYYNATGSVTWVAANVRQVEFTLDLRSPQGKSLFDRSRMPRVRVELMN